MTFMRGTVLLPGDPEGKKQLSKYPVSPSFLLLTSSWGYPLANPNRKLDSKREYHAIPTRQPPKRKQVGEGWRVKLEEQADTIQGTPTPFEKIERMKPLRVQMTCPKLLG